MTLNQDTPQQVNFYNNQIAPAAIDPLATGDDVHRFGRREVVADWTDAAQPLHRDRDFSVGPALDERLEAAKLDNVQAHLMDAVVLVEQDRNFAVTFDPGDRLDRDAPQRLRLLGGFQTSSSGPPLSRSSSPWVRAAACGRG